MFLLYLNTHTLGGALHNSHCHFDIRRVEVFHLGLSNFPYLVTGQFAFRLSACFTGALIQTQAF